MARSSDRLAFILWEAPLLNNKPLRLFLKTERFHTKYATHIDLPAGCTSTFGGICDFHCAEHGSCPKFCACVDTVSKTCVSSKVLIFVVK